MGFFRMDRAFRPLVPFCIREGLSQLTRRPLRSLLVLQAIVWSTAAAILPQALYKGTEHTAFLRAGEFAADRILVGTPQGAVCSSWQEIETIRRVHPALLAATGVAVEKSKGLFLVGADAAHLHARRLVIAAGRYFSTKELREGLPVAVLESRAAAELFPSGDALGRKIEIAGGRTLTVIGVLSPLPEAVLKTDALGYGKSRPFRFLAVAFLRNMGILPPRVPWLTSEKCMLVPWPLMGKKPQWLVLRAEPQKLREVITSLRRYFSAKGRDVLLYANLVVAALTAPEIKIFFQLSRDVFLLCLILGLIVVANAMLLAVNERKLEIAVRRCEGATRGQIVLQFMVEGAVFTTAGSCIGIPLGIVLAWARATVSPASLLSWAVPWGEAAVIFAVVCAGGMLAGLLPAWRAARLDPVEVLARG